MVVAQQKGIEVADFVRRAMDGASDYAEGAKRLLAMAKDNPELYRKLMGPVEFTACLDACRQNTRSERKTIWHAPVAKPKTSVKALARANSYTLLDFPLPGGMRLADATKGDVLAAVEVYRKQATDMGHKANWLDAIAAKMTGKKRVASVFDARTLEQLQAQV